MGIEGDQAVIFDGDKMSGSFKVPITVLQKFWFGNFRFIWRVPSYRTPIVLPGQITEESDWLDNAFEVVKRRYQKSRPEIFKHWPDKSGFSSRGQCFNTPSFQVVAYLNLIVGLFVVNFLGVHVNNIPCDFGKFNILVFSCFSNM